MKKSVMLLFFVIFCIIFIFSGRTFAQDAGWMPVPTGTEYLSGIWGTSGSDIFAVGDIGTVLHYDGSSWTPMSSGTYYPLSKVWGSSGSDVFAVGYEGTIIRYDGRQWKSMNSGTDDLLLDVWGSSRSDVFAVGERGTILHYDGSKWSAMNSGTKETAFRGVWGSSGSDVFAVGDNGTILHYNGSGWSLMDSGTDEDLYSVWGRSGSDVFAVGYETVLHYDGRKWSLEEDISSNMEYIELRDVWTGQGANVFALGNTEWIAEYDNKTWSFAATDFNLLGVWGNAAENKAGAGLFAVGYGGVILHYDGSEWNVMRQGMHESLTKMWGSSETDIFAAGFNGTILHYDVLAWTSMNSGTDKSLRNVWGSSGTDVFAVGDYGVILHYDGAVWTPMNSGTDKSLRDVWGSSGTDVFAVGDKGLILHYDGSAWTPMDSGTDGDIWGIWGSSGTDLFAAEFFGKILHYDGSDWVQMEMEKNSFVEIWGSKYETRPGFDLFAMGDKGLIMYYDGAVWMPMESGVEESLTDMDGRESDFFAVGDNGTVLHHDGTEWTQMNSLTNLYLYSVWSPQNGTVPGSDVFFTGYYGTLRHFRYSALGLICPGSVREGENRVIGEVRVADAVANDLTIHLISGDPSEISVPETVTIQAGNTSASFEMIISDDIYPDGTQQVSVTASAPGYFSYKTIIPVDDNETSEIRMTLPPEIREGDTGLFGEIHLCRSDPDCDDPVCECIPVTAVKEITLFLSSDDATEIRVPKQVIVPAGESGVKFDVIIADDTEIDDIQSASVSAWVEGWTRSTVVLNIQDNDRYVISVKIPNNMTEGNPVMTGTVYLSESFPSDVTVSLSSGDASELIVSPSLITIPAGSISADFEMTAVEDGTPDGDQIVALRASAPGWKSTGAAVSEESAALRAYNLNWNPEDAAVRIRDTDQKLDIMRYRPDFKAIWGNSGKDIFALGDYGAILHYDGLEWTLIPSGTGEHLSGLWGHTTENGGLGTEVFAVGGPDCVILHYDGKEWLPMETSSDAIYPGFRALNDVWSRTSENGLETGAFAVGNYGTILHYDGKEWLPMESGTDQHIESVWGYTVENGLKTELFAVGNYGTIMHYNGKEWLPMKSGFDLSLFDIWGYAGENGLDVFAVGLMGTILHYNGESWNSMESGTDEQLMGVWGRSDQNGQTEVFAVGFNGTIQHYDGKSWNPMESGTDEDLYGIWGHDEENGHGLEVFAAGDNGTIIRYDGKAWNPVDIPYEEMSLRDVWCQPAETGLPQESFAVGDDGVILHYTGEGWTRSGTGTDWQMNLSGVWGMASEELTEPAQVFAVGELGTVLHYDGEKWYKRENITDKNLRDVRGSSLEDVYAVGDDGTILHYDGAGWMHQESGTGAGLNGVWCAPPDADYCSEVFITGNSGIILHRACPGALSEKVPAWKVMESGTDKNLNAVWGSSASDIFAVGDDKTILHYDGSVWQQMDPGEKVPYGTDPKSDFYGIWGSVSENGLGIQVFAVNYDSILYYDGAKWSSLEESFNSVKTPRGICGCSGGDIFIVGELGGAIAHYSAFMLSIPQTAREGTGTVQGTVKIPAPRESDLTVRLTSADPDEVRVPEVLIIPAGETSAVFDLYILDDDLTDGTQIAAVIATAPGDKILNGGRAEIRITDNETAILSVSLPETANEGDGAITGVVFMNEPAGKDVAVTLNLEGFEDDLLAVTIPEGETSAEFTAALNDDTEFGIAKSAVVTASVENWTSGTASISVADNEAARLALGIPGTASETDGVLTGTVTIPGTFPEDITVFLSSDDLSEITVPESIVIPAGETSASFDLTLIDDPEIDGVQSVTLTASAEGWTPAEARTEITDNDPGILEFSAERYAVLESSGDAVITVTRIGSKDGGISADYSAEYGTAAEGDDFAPVSGTFVFASGETEKSFSVPIIEDGIGEGTETVFLRLDIYGAGVSGYQKTAVLVIADSAGWHTEEVPTEYHLSAVWGSSHSDVFAAGSRGTVLHYDGSEWTRMEIGASEIVRFEDIWGSSGENVFIAGTFGQEGVIFHYDGKKWTGADTGNAAPLYAVWGASASDVYAGGSGVLLHYDGSIWRDISADTGVTPDILAIWGSSETDIFAAETSGRILHYDGKAWTRTETGTDAAIYGVWGSSPSDVFAVGAKGTILHYDGETWRLADTGTEEDTPFILGGVGGSSPSDVFAVGSGGIILHYDGVAWIPEESGTESILSGIWGDDSLNIFAVGENGTLLHYGGVQK